MTDIQRAGINQVFICKACSTAFVDRAGQEPVDLPWDEVFADPSPEDPARKSMRLTVVKPDAAYTAQCATDGHVIALADSRVLRFARGGNVKMLDPTTKAHTRDTFKPDPTGEPHLIGARYLE